MRLRTLTALLLTLAWLFPASPAVAAGATTPPFSVTAVARADFGLNVFPDQQLAGKGALTALRKLGTGLQQFPNLGPWSWLENRSKPSGGTDPVTLKHWGRILSSSGNQGLLIFSYDANPTFTGGGTPADARALTRYIVSHQLPITAMVIGSEEYGNWDFAANENPQKTAAYYGQRSDAIARAIHQVDPRMRVGVVFDPDHSPYALAWNQTVLRLTAPDINFVSFHLYPISQPLSNAALLRQIPQIIANETAYIKHQIEHNVPPALVGHIGLWVTEFNPYGPPTPQSTQPVYGAAWVESLLAWRAFGAQRVVVWSFDGQAHVSGPNYPLAPAGASSYDLFALVGDGQAPEIPIDQLYPSGKAIGRLMQAIGSGATLSTWIGDGMFIGQLAGPQGLQACFVNQTDVSRQLTVNGQSVTVPAASFLVRSLSRPIRGIAGFTPAPYAKLASVAAYHPKAPYIADPPDTAYPGEDFTLTGEGFGTRPGYVMLTQGQVQYGAPFNVYKVAIQSWSPRSVTIRLPDGYSGPALQPAVDASLRIVTAGRMVTRKETFAVASPPTGNLAEQATATYTAVHGSSARSRFLAGARLVGQTLTLTGQAFGSKPSLQSASCGGMNQNRLEIRDLTNNANYGYDGSGANCYGLSFQQWSNTRIVLTFGPGAPKAGDVLEILYWGAATDPFTINVVAANP